jgi:hypothetical protein
MPLSDTQVIGEFDSPAPHHGSIVKRYHTCLSRKRSGFDFPVGSPYGRDWLVARECLINTFKVGFNSHLPYHKSITSISVPARTSDCQSVRTLVWRTDSPNKKGPN